MVTAIITLSNIHGIGDTDTAFVAVYSLIFALLLSIYEFSHCGCCYEEVEERCGGFYRKVRKMRSEPHIFLLPYLRWCVPCSVQNFGFLYSAISRGLFLIFIALLQFGMKAGPGSGGNDNWMGIMTGSFLIFEGVIMMLVACRYPELMKEKRRSSQPQAGGQV